MRVSKVNPRLESLMYLPLAVLSSGIYGACFQKVISEPNAKLSFILAVGAGTFVSIGATAHLARVVIQGSTKKSSSALSIS